jgi:hypothetical protein
MHPRARSPLRWMDSAPAAPLTLGGYRPTMSLVNPPSLCTRCGGGLVEGFLLDHSHGAHVVSQWVTANEKDFRDIPGLKMAAVRAG